MNVPPIAGKTTSRRSLPRHLFEHAAKQRRGPVQCPILLIVKRNLQHTFDASRADHGRKTEEQIAQTVRGGDVRRNRED